MGKGPNMHTIDRFVRLIIGVICVYIGFVDTSLISSQPVSIVVGVFGAVNIWAFITTRCPVYTMAGFSTATNLEIDKQSEHESTY